MNGLRLVEAGLATWRLAHMVTREEGPWSVFRWIRERTGIEHDENGVPSAWPVGNPLTCIWCMSVWIAPVMLLCPWLARVLAVSGVAVLVEGWRAYYDLAKD